MSRSLDTLRHILAPGAGAAVMIATALAFPDQLLAALLVGGLVWVGTSSLLSRYNPFAGLRGRADLAIDGEVLERELLEASDRVRTIEKAAGSITDEDVRQALSRIAASSRDLLNDVRRDPADYPQVRRALVHYLGHASVIATGVERMPEEGLPVLGRAREMLPRLADQFDAYRLRVFEADAFDIDTRIAVLEQDLRQVASPIADKAAEKGDLKR